jgi:ketosteroid isomerase-like protein
MLAWILAIALTADPLLETGSDVAAPTPTPAIYQQDVQLITQLLSDQYAAWTRHDLDAYMIPFWKSPNLLYVSDGQVFQGWEEAKAMMERNYPDRNTLGVAIPERIQVNIISNDFATSIDWWTIRFKSNTSVHGMSTASWRKFPEGWRMVEAHASSSELSN